MRVQHAAPSASGGLLLGSAAVNWPCGPCTLVPDPVASLPTALDASGNGQVTFALHNNPGLRGQSFLAQWLVIAPGGCSALGWSFSNAVDVTIE